MKTTPQATRALALSFLLLLAVSVAPRSVHAQMQPSVNTAQQVTLAGLRSANGAGNFPAAAYAADGSLVLLYDQHDGVRVLKFNSAGTALLAQAQLGSTGDAAIAIALDPAGNVYVAGTTSSGNLPTTAGAAFRTRADTSTNSFLAKFDTQLNPLFVTYCGAGRTAATSVAATADAAFVTGITFNATFPVTANGIQQTPAPGTTENGFVERFNASGATLVYATYLTGANGTTAPAAIVADAADDAFLAGYTSATGYPTVNALVPNLISALGSTSANSGFLTRLTPAGDGFAWSTFLPGTGITGLALDAASNTLLLTGTIAPGQFPVATVAAPLAPATYQSFLRIPVDGQSVTASALLVPGSQSTVAAGPNGAAWIAGSLRSLPPTTSASSQSIAAPLFPGDSQPLALFGDAFALHLTAGTRIDQTVRFGGAPAGLAGTTALSTTPGMLATAANGQTLALPATLTASNPGTQRFDLPLTNAPNAALPNTLRDLAATCSGSGSCTPSAAYLTLLSTAAAAPSLALSADNFPNLLLRNLGSATASGLAIAATGFTVATNCTTALAPSNICAIALSGTGPGSLSVSAANAATQTIALPATTLTADPFAILPVALDFGIATAATAASRTLAITNLSATTQNFTSALDIPARTTLPYTVTETSDCPTTGTGQKTLAPASTCHITLALQVSANAANDGPITVNYKVATHDVALTAFAEAAALNVSATEVDFGTQFSGSPRNLPRYLFLSNNSPAPIPHAPATLPAPFTLTDACPTTLEPQTVCRMTITYTATTAPSADATILNLDQGISVLITGQTLPPQGATASTANPNISVTPTTLNFPNTIVTSGVSASPQIVTVTNTGGAGVALTVAVTGDFTISSGCPSTLAAGASCQIQVNATPSAPGARSGLLSVTGGSTFAPAYVTLTATASPLLPPNNGTLDLGQTLLGEPTVLFYKVQQPLATLTVTSSNPVFGVAIIDGTTGPPSQNTLPAYAFAPTVTSTCSACYIGVQFLPQTVGQQATTLSLSTTAAGKAYTLAATGTALPVSGLVLTPVTQDFGPVTINSSTSPRIFQLTNLLTPPASATITSITTTGDFQVAANATGGASCTGTLTPSASCYVAILFAPTQAAPRTGTLTLVTSVGSITSALTGNGLEDPGYALNPNQLDFQNAPGTAALQQTIVLSNTSTAPLVVGAPSTSNPAFTASSTCGTLAAGATCSISVTFAPGASIVHALLTIPLTRILNGQTLTTAAQASLNGLYTSEDAGLEILPDAANFGSTPTGAVGATRQFTLNNLTAHPANVALSLPRQFALATPNACPTLAAMGSCTFSVAFLPATGGELTGTIFAVATPTDGSPTLQNLAYAIGYGSATGSLAISGPGIIAGSPLNFGVITSGQTAQSTLTLTNSGTAALTVRRITSEPPFLATTTCGATLTPNQTCTATITYAPINQIAAGTTSVPRSDAGFLVVESDAGSSPNVIALSGSAGPVTAASPVSDATLATYQLSQGALTFANTQVGSAAAPQTVTLTNAGTSTLHLLGTTLPPDFTLGTTCSTIAPATSCTLTVTFAPVASGASTTRSGTLELRTDAAVDLDFISLFGTTSAAPLTITPTALDFGTVNVGSSGSLFVTITNTTAAPIVFNSISATGDYTAAIGTCPAPTQTLAAGASCQLSVTFTPTTIGTRTGTLSIATNATPLPLTVSLTGNATSARLQVTPGALNFGSIAVGAPATLSLTLLDTGNAPVNSISEAILGTNPADFAVTTPCSTATLAPNQGCTVIVTFTPAAVGGRSASLLIASSDPASPAVVPLSGTGAAAGSFTLTVNGTSSASTTVKSGSPATFALAVTPTNGFTGTVALTCSAVVPATYASCSLTPSMLTLSAGATQTATATINTITTASNHTPFLNPAGPGIFLALAPLLLLSNRRRKRFRKSAVRLALFAILSCLALGSVACGGGSGGGNASNTRSTPAGSYQYQVTATSTSGTTVTQTVTLNLIVQ